MFVRRGEAIFNQAIVIDPAGRVVGRYNKMFPFLPFEKHVAAGNEFLAFDVPEVGRFGLSICYDIWIPETTRTLAVQGVEVLLHPVLTGTTDRSAEIAIARATAAMFQCYVIDVNGLLAGGVGHSLVALIRAGVSSTRLAKPRRYFPSRSTSTSSGALARSAPTAWARC
jgi:deaminated glutathione amidase